MQRRLYETIFEVEGLGIGRYGVAQQCSNADLFGNPRRSQNRILKQSTADALACPIRMYGKSAKNNNWNGIGRIAPEVSGRAVTSRGRPNTRVTSGHSNRSIVRDP